VDTDAPALTVAHGRDEDAATRGAVGLAGHESPHPRSRGHVPTSDRLAE